MWKQTEYLASFELDMTILALYIFESCIKIQINCLHKWTKASKI